MTNGYCVLRSAVPVAKCNEILGVAKTRHWAKLFQAYDVFDEYRFQSLISESIMEDLKSRLMPLAKIHFPNATLYDFYFVKSEKGGPRQAPHRGFDLPMPCMYVCITCYSMILMLQFLMLSMS